MSGAGPVLQVALALSALMIAAAVALASWRMVRGPGIADRAVAMDLLGLLALTGSALAALAAGHLALLDVALGLGLIGFIGAVAMAGFIERASQPRSAEQEGDGHG
ncbi:hypothetical protein GCM10010964_29900 [Caldovatus sediminis]|uniref:Cation:proton antiporter n=1 Tax=Caldovatus sediminis TaxID=2041189 RepID=A0A8J3ED85_9PROT|nr:monovalent cation/H+ antiporter complex subunit F [Caldovatus sediminis]GGG40319.1 hypothetical protein GCM10010964_29900 [Caldovatus sediminis]